MTNTHAVSVAGPEVLLVEDSPTQAADLEALLTRHGYQVVVVPTAEAALERLGTYLPHLVVTDIQMPGINGYELCRRIKWDLRTSRVPVILLTALGDGERLTKGRECGADNFITKPYEHPCLLSRIHLTLARAALLADSC